MAIFIFGKENGFKRFKKAKQNNAIMTLQMFKQGSTAKEMTAKEMTAKKMTAKEMISKRVSSASIINIT